MDFSFMVDTPAGLSKLRPGMTISVVTVPRWYEKAWAWLKRVVWHGWLRRPVPKVPVLIVSDVDNLTRTITYRTEYR